MTEVSKPTTYQVQSGDNLWKISQKTGKSVAEIKAANPSIKDDVVKIGQKLSLGEVVSVKTTKKSVSTGNKSSIFSTPETTSPIQVSTTGATKTSSGIMTLAKYDSNQPEEINKFKLLVKNKEGKVLTPYIEPNGMAAIGHGHQLINKPKFLTDIENQKLSPAEKNKKLKEALNNQQNKIALKTSLAKDLADAMQTTGIKNIATTVNNNLKLTEDQIKLLLNSDIKKAHNAMEKDMGKTVLSQRTANQKLVALDLYYNIGANLKSKAPDFVKYFKEGNISKAQAELDLFKSNGKIYLGLMRRNYERMQLLNDNKGVSQEAQAKLLKAYNEYCTQNGKQIACNFTQAEKKLKA